jgi:hypothetical protein
MGQANKALAMKRQVALIKAGAATTPERSWVLVDQTSVPSCWQQGLTVQQQKCPSVEVHAGRSGSTWAHCSNQPSVGVTEPRWRELD